MPTWVLLTPGYVDKSDEWYRMPPNWRKHDMTMTAAKGSRERRSLPRGQVDAARSAVKVCLHAVFLLMLCSPMAAYSAPPDLKTPTPVIYLADNLDEQDNLGFCIDTVGRGFAERLHAHSANRAAVMSSSTMTGGALFRRPTRESARRSRLPRPPGSPSDCWIVPRRPPARSSTTMSMRWSSGPGPTGTSAWWWAPKAGRPGLSCHEASSSRPALQPMPRANSGASKGAGRKARGELASVPWGIARERRGLTRSPEANIKRK